MLLPKLAKLAKQTTLATVINHPRDHRDDDAGAAEEPGVALRMILNASAASDVEEEDAQAALALQPKLQQIAQLPPGYQKAAS